MTESDKLLLTGIITERAARSVSPRERAALIVQQMAHWPGLSSEEGWIVTLETILAELAAAKKYLADDENQKGKQR